MTRSADTPVTTSGTRYVFNSWPGDGTGTTAALRSVTMNGPRTVNANYDTQYLLTLTTGPAAVGTAHIQGGSDGTYYAAGTPLTLSADTPVTNSGTRYVFNNWSGDGTGTTAALRSVTMNGPRTVNANYDTQYLLTLTTGPAAVGTAHIQGGSDGTYYAAGTPLTLSADTPVTNSGTRYVFNNWSGDGTGTTAALRSVTMNGPRTVNANYDTQYLLTLTTGPAAVGTAHIQGGSDGTYYAAGTPLTLSADTPVTNSGTRYVFNNWSGDGTGTTAALRSVTMNGPRTVNANYDTQYLLTLTTGPAAVGTAHIQGGSDGTYYAAGTPLTLSADTPVTNSGTRYVFNNWSGDGTGTTAALRSVTMNGPRTVNANYDTQYLLTLTTGPAAVGTAHIQGGSDGTYYAAGTPLTLSADTPVTNSGTRYVFNNWSGDGTGTTAALRSVTMNGPRTVNANYDTQYLLTLTTGPAAVGTAHIQGGSDGTYYAAGTPLTLSADTPVTNSGTRYVFNNWSGDGTGTTAALRSVTMNGPRTVNANYDTQYLLTLTTGPAAVGTAHIQGGSDGTYYAAGTPLTLSADTPVTNSGTRYVFNNWSGDGTGTTAALRSVTMNGPRTVNANYDTQYLLTLTTGPAAVGTAHIQGGSDGTYYAAGTPLTLSADTPVTNSGTRYVFNNWSGDGTGTTAALRSVTMNGPRTVNANYDTQYLLTLTTGPAAVGTAHIQGGSDGTYYAAGTPLTLSADTPVTNSGTRYVFNNWSGDGTGTTAALRSVTMNGPRTVNANYDTQYLLTLTTGPAAVGTAHIQGGSDGTYYAAGTPLTLSADTPVTNSGTRYVFNNWSGDGTGTTAALRSVTKNGPRPLNPHSYPQCLSSFPTGPAAVGTAHIQGG